MGLRHRAEDPPPAPAAIAHQHRTRLATLPLLGMIATLQLFVYPSAWPEHLVWGSILLFLLTRGPGAVSLDHLIARAGAGHRA